MTTHDHSGHHGHQTPGAVLEVEFRNCHDGSEFADLERSLTRVPGVTSVHIDRTRAVAHLGYDRGTVTEAELRHRLHGAGYDCACRDCAPSTAQPGHPSVGDEHNGDQAHDHAAMNHADAGVALELER